MNSSQKWTTGFVPLWLALLLIFSEKAGAQTIQIRKSVVSAAGGISQSATFKALMTVGQSTPSGLSESAGFKVSAGFLAEIPAPVIETVSFTPTADAYVKSNAPTDNFGTTTHLRLRQSSNMIMRSYLKFTVTGVSGSVQSARLRLKVTQAGDNGGSVFLVSDNYLDNSGPWTETGLNYDNAPEISGTPLSSVSSVTKDQTVEFEVTPVISGNSTYSFGLENNSSDIVHYSSKEGETAPELVIQFVEAASLLSGLSLSEASVTKGKSGAVNAKVAEAQEEGKIDEVDRGGAPLTFNSTDELNAESALPERFSLSPAYPNPFNAQTIFEYALPQPGNVRLTIYNSLGQMVRRLVDEYQKEGYKRILWDGANENGVSVSSGMYFYQLELGQEKLVGRMILQR
jgi:hypothetical protein